MRVDDVDDVATDSATGAGDLLCFLCLRFFFSSWCCVTSEGVLDESAAARTVRLGLGGLVLPVLTEEPLLLLLGMGVGESRGLMAGDTFWEDVLEWVRVCFTLGMRRMCCCVFDCCCCCCC